MTTQIVYSPSKLPHPSKISARSQLISMLGMGQSTKDGIYMVSTL